jgi:hypothetical protein
MKSQAKLCEENLPVNAEFRDSEERGALSL